MSDQLGEVKPVADAPQVVALELTDLQAALLLKANDAVTAAQDRRATLISMVLAQHMIADAFVLRVTPTSPHTMLVQLSRPTQPVVE